MNLQVLPRRVSHGYLASGERQDRTEPALVQKSGHVDDDINIPALDVFYGMDGRKRHCIKKCWIGNREEDAADLRGNELNELLEMMTALSTISR